MHTSECGCGCDVKSQVVLDVISWLCVCSVSLSATLCWIKITYDTSIIIIIASWPETLEGLKIINPAIWLVKTVSLVYLEIPASLLSAPHTSSSFCYHHDNDQGNHVIPNSNRLWTWWWEELTRGKRNLLESGISIEFWKYFGISQLDQYACMHWIHGAATFDHTHEAPLNISVGDWELFRC